MKNKLKIGDRLYRSKWLVEHAGISLGNGRVIHNSPDGDVQICTLDEYSAGKPVKVMLSELNKEKQNELLNQVEQLTSQEKNYNVLSYNCEHLASSVLSCKPKSEQLRGVGLGAAAGVLLACSKKSKNSLLYMLAGGLMGCIAVNAYRQYDFSI